MKTVTATKFKETEIGPIPEEWDLKALKKLTIKIGSGATPRGGSSVYSEDGPYILIRSQNIFDDKFEYSGLAHIDNKQAEELKNVEVKENDILLNITGASLGRVNIVPRNILPARVNQHVAILRTNENLNPYFLKCYLNLPNIKSYILGHNAGATREAITKEMIERFLIPVPSISEQKQIAEILSSLGGKIELNRKINANLEKLAGSLFKQWFVDIGDELPRGWRMGTFGEAIQNFDSKRIPLHSGEREKKQGLYPYYGATSVMDYVDDYIFDGKYVLLGEDGSVVKENGKPFVQYVCGKIWVNNHAHVLQGKNGFSTEYIKIFLDHLYISPFVTGAVQPKVNQSNMNRIPMIIPDQKILGKFNEISATLFEVILENEKQTKNLEQIRDSLLPRLMSGKIRV